MEEPSVPSEKVALTSIVRATPVSLALGTVLTALGGAVSEEVTG